MATPRDEIQGIVRLAAGVLAIVVLLAWWKAERVNFSDAAVPSAEATTEGSLEATEAPAPSAAQRASAPPPAGPPCFGGIILPPGWKALQRCFAAIDSANDIVRQLRGGHLHATTEKTEAGQYAVRYQPMTEAQARAEGEVALAGRRPHGSGIYQLEVQAQEIVDSYAWRVTMPCPDGWADAGSFKLTAYVLAQERDFPAEPTVEDPCGLEGTYPQKFLFGEGVRLQGSGITNAGQILHFRGNNCFEELDCARTAVGRCAKTGRTIAVDPKVISLGSEVLVEDIGYRIAEDTGGAIRGSHIDVYYGTALRLRQAWAHTREDRKICVRPREMAL